MREHILSSQAPWFCFKAMYPGLSSFNKNWSSHTQPKMKDPKYPLFRSKIFAANLLPAVDCAPARFWLEQIPSYIEKDRSFLEIFISKIRHLDWFGFVQGEIFLFFISIAAGCCFIVCCFMLSSAPSVFVHRRNSGEY